MTTISSPAPNRLAGVSENNLQRIQDVIDTSLDRRTGIDQTRAPSNKVAQVFPTPGSIFGAPNRIPQYRTDQIIVGSFDPNPSFGQGAAAGFFEKYIDGPLASMATNTRAISDAESRSLVGILNKLVAQKKRNNGQALSRISLESHGGSASLLLGDNNDYSVHQIVTNIMKRNLLKVGGRLVLGGCSIADTPSARVQLSKLAKIFKIVIQASEVMTFGAGSINLAYWAFFPNGTSTRNVGPFAPF